MAGVYWIGQDGNVYVPNADGSAFNVGKPLQDYEGGVRAQRQEVQGVRINDPNPGGTKPAASTPAPRPISSGGTAGPAAPTVDQTAVSNTNKAISSLDTTLAVGNQSIDADYGNVVGKYDREAQKAQGDYDTQTVTNNTNFQKGKQNALVSAAQGRRGLRGSLSAIGALSGDGQVLADRAVTQGANEDIGGATDTAKTNATMLDKSIGDFRDEDAQRRAEAETARNNSKVALDRDVTSKRQSFLQKLAEIFSAGGNTAEANNYSNQAGDLNQVIASKGGVQASPITAKAANFTPDSLAGYLSGAGDMTVQVAQGDQGGVSPATILAKKREDKLKAIA